MEAMLSYHMTISTLVALCPLAPCSWLICHTSGGNHDRNVAIGVIALAVQFFCAWDNVASMLMGWNRNDECWFTGPHNADQTQPGQRHNSLTQVLVPLTCISSLNYILPLAQLGSKNCVHFEIFSYKRAYSTTTHVRHS